MVISGVTDGQAGGRGQSAPRDFFADVSGKKGKGVKIEKKRRKIVNGRWKIVNGSRKNSTKEKEVRTFFLFLSFFFFFSLLFTFENDGNLFWVLGVPKWEFSTGKKEFHAGKKIWKNDFAPSEIYVCYAPADGDAVR